MRYLPVFLACTLAADACQAPLTSERDPIADDAADDVAGVAGSGFVIRSADGRNELQIGGLFQVTAGAFGGDREPSSEFALRRMRPEFTGRFQDALRFTLEPNFVEDGVELEEAWIGTELQGGDSILMFGRMKAPFNLEEVRTRRHIDFTHFSILNQFAPAEDHGVFWNGLAGGGRWEYGLAAYNGTGGSDTTSSKDVAVRLMAHPFVQRDDSHWRNLQLGLAATLGQQDEDVGGNVIENELGLPLVHFGPDLRLNGTRTRVGAELAWFDGPNFLQSEAILVSQDMEDTAGDGRIGFRGVYLTVSHVLTGEAKSFDGVTPAQPHDFGTGAGGGAWVLAARYSELHLDDDLEDLGFVVPGTFTDRVRTVSLGLNWVPNTNAILRCAVIHSAYSEEVDLGSGSDDQELGVLLEAQLHF